MAKESLSRYAPRPWGMQPNTSLAALSSRFPWAFLCTCLCAYYTIFPSGGRSVLPTFWNIWYNCLIKLNALLVRPREYLYIPKDNGLRAGCGNVFCRVPFVGCCPAVEGHARTFCIGLRGFFLPRQNACEVKNDRPDETCHNNPLHGPLRRSCERGDGRDFDTLIPDFS